MEPVPLRGSLQLEPLFRLDVGQPIGQRRAVPVQLGEGRRGFLAAYADEIWFVDNPDESHPLGLSHYRLCRLDAVTGERTDDWPWPRKGGTGQSLSHTFRNFIVGGHVRGEPGARGSHMCPVVALDGSGVDHLLWGERCLSLDAGGQQVAMAIRIGAKTCGPDGRFHDNMEEFAWDAVTGKPVDHPGEQLLSYAADGVLTLWADRAAEDSDDALARYAHPFYRTIERLSSSGSHLGAMAGLS